MTPQQIEAMKLALEYIEAVPDDRYSAEHIDREALITAIEKVLADHAMQKVQRLGQEIEPDDIASILACREMLDAQPVPPQRKPLTDEEIWDAYMKAPVDIDCHVSDLHKFARAIEAAHDIKETT